MTNRPAPRGAILMMSMVLLSILAVLVALLARSAVALNDKSRSMALADASAKSVATWYAQILNYDAYSNRAIAANEIMIAQAVTLTAWTQYVQSLAQNAGTVMTVVPALQSLATWMQEVAEVSHQMAKTGASVEVPLRSAYTRALLASQQVMHASATPFAAQAMANEVIWTADSRFFGQIIPSSDISAFYRFTTAYGDEQRRPLADLIQSSQDQFSRRRSFDQRLYLAPSVSCIPRGIEQAFGKLMRRGGTELSDDLQNWRSADTLSLHTWRRRSRWSPWCSRLGETVPFGWGASDTDESASRLDDFPQEISSVNPGAMERARGASASTMGYLGLSSFRELNPTLASDRKSARIRIPVLIRLASDKTAAITWSARRLSALGESPLQSKFWSLGVGETYFHRPADTMTDPASRDFANLFMPFWMSRLVPPSATDRAVALVYAQGQKP